MSSSLITLPTACRRLPARESVASVAAGCILGLDSRAVAALLKELAKTGNGHRAHEFFDYILGLGDQHEAARLCDVFTYTAAISICNNDQQVCEPCSIRGLQASLPERSWATANLAAFTHHVHHATLRHP